ncbi:CidA/LrgA family protein [Gallaecimonas sp. GXIMD1310]|uniref:CidA/LrgA family protein n=1 Tax=Gallaecimonas sp. GXIMD1310 TaxID=3131926 RepID=UPI00324E9865
MKLLRAFAVIFACLYLGKGLVQLTGLPIPGAIVGLLLLFVLLSTGLLAGSWPAPAASLLMRHMTLLFIPAGVGLINYLDLLSRHAAVLLGTTLISTWLVIALVGWLHQAMEKRHGR